MGNTQSLQEKWEEKRRQEQLAEDKILNDSIKPYSLYDSKGRYILRRIQYFLNCDVYATANVQLSLQPNFVEVYRADHSQIYRSSYNMNAIGVSAKIDDFETIFSVSANPTMVEISNKIDQALEAFIETVRKYDYISLYIRGYRVTLLENTTMDIQLHNIYVLVNNINRFTFNWRKGGDAAPYTHDPNDCVIGDTILAPRKLKEH